jgi:hypothetical protein
MMVLMALFTTFMTSPVLELICPDRLIRASSETVPRQVPVPQLDLKATDGSAA